MIKDEAIKWLKWVADNPYLDVPIKWKVSRAAKEGIMALESKVSCDCISREDFENMIRPYDTDNVLDRFLYTFAHNMVMSCPSVSYERSIGHWIKFSEGDILFWKCSRCGSITDSDMDDYDWRYCPFCGSRMIEKGDTYEK